MLKGYLNCDEISELILKYIEDKLPSKKAQRVALHLRNCPVCMEKYGMIKKMLDNLKEKRNKELKNFKRFELINAYCDREVKNSTREKMTELKNMSLALEREIERINSLKKLLNKGFENKFANLELNLEKGVIERLKNKNLLQKLINW